MNTSIQHHKKLRIDLMVHLETRVFEEIDGEVVQILAFVLERRK
jgi:hypothetical protein